MRSLFIKIFLWFWLAMTLVGGCILILALTTDADGDNHEQQQRRYHLESQTLITAYESGGRAALADTLRKLEQSTGQQAFLFRDDTNLAGDGALPPPLRTLVNQAAKTRVNEVQAGDREIWVAFPATSHYVYLVKRIRPSALARILNPRALGLRLLITFIIAGGICYLLARSLTAPIAKLQGATRRLAAGALSTRVRDQIRGHDEIAALAGDFDQMAERIEGLVNSQGRLLRDISHELRSPLARLNLALELARQDSRLADSPALDRIERESGRLNELIGLLMNLVRLEDGSENLPMATVDLARLVREIATDADFEARQRRREVVCSIPRPVVIQASAELLHQAIENVVRNAVRCTAEQTSVEISLDDQDNLVTVRVRDHGPGVPKSDLERIFHPFFRSEVARDRQSGGIGLGLAITARAVRLHGGRVAAGNRAGGGLEVVITLPLKRAPEPGTPL